MRQQKRIFLFPDYLPLRLQNSRFTSIDSGWNYAGITAAKGYGAVTLFLYIEPPPACRDLVHFSEKEDSALSISAIFDTAIFLDCTNWRGPQ